MYSRLFWDRDRDEATPTIGNDLAYNYCDVVFNEEQRSPQTFFVSRRRRRRRIEIT